GLIGSGRWRRWMPGSTSRILASSDTRLLVQAVLDEEGHLHLHVPTGDAAVLDRAADLLHLDPADALDRHRRARHGQIDRVLDAVRRATGERDGFLDHGVALSRARTLRDLT